MDDRSSAGRTEASSRCGPGVRSRNSSQVTWGSGVSWVGGVRGEVRVGIAAGGGRGRPGEPLLGLPSREEGTVAPIMLRVAAKV